MASRRPTPISSRWSTECAEVRRRHGLSDVKLVLITNASLLHRPRVRRALATLDANGGEIWAKLDAGREDYYRLVARSAVPWPQILSNLQEAAQARPIVIQSLWMRIGGEPPPPAELAAYCDRLREILAAGGQIKLVQIHTVARKPAEAFVAALSNAEVDAIAELVRSRTALPTAAFYGAAERGKIFPTLYFRCRILARLRRFLRPIFRRPFPVFLVPTERSVMTKKVGLSPAHTRSTPY